MKGYDVYIINGEERVVENERVYPGFVIFYNADDNVLYQIRSSYPVDVMLRIAESIH